MAVTFGPPLKEESEKKRVLDGRKPDGGKLEKKPEGKEKAPETTKTKLEDLKPEFRGFILYGIKILRERDPEKNTIKFYEGTKDKPIPNLKEWIINKLKDIEKKKIEESLKPYERLFESLNLSETEKQTRLKALKEKCFKLHQEGKTPGKLDEIPGNINLVIKKAGATQFSVNANAEKITIPYAMVLPPHVSTIIVTRENPDTKQKVQIVCIKYGSKGNEHFLDAESGKPIFLKPNDLVDIASVNAPETAPVKAKTVSSDVKSSSRDGGGGYVGGGGYSGGGYYGGGGGSSPAVGPSGPSGTPNEPKDTLKDTSKNAPKMTNDDFSAAKKQTKETPENYGEGDFNIIKFENREFNGGRPIHLCTFPKKLDPDKPTRFILYFHGFGVSSEKASDMFQNKQMTGGFEKFSKEKKENIVFVLPQGENNIPKKGNYWNETVSSESGIENLINYSLYRAFEGKNKPDAKVDKYIMGHSGANYAMENVLKNMSANYFKGIGLFDTLYSKGMGAKYARLLKEKHNKTDVYSVYRTIGAPGENNPILRNEMSSKSSGPKGHFETRPAGSGHSAMKYPGVSAAVEYFAKKETPVAPQEPSAPKNPDQRTA